MRLVRERLSVANGLGGQERPTPGTHLPAAHCVHCRIVGPDHTACGAPLSTPFLGFAPSSQEARLSPVQRVQIALQEPGMQRLQRPAVFDVLPVGAALDEGQR